MGISMARWLGVRCGGCCLCSVIVDAIVGRLSEKAAVVTLVAAVSPWPGPTGLRLLGRGAVRASSPSRWASHVCARCHLVTGGCTALLAALPQWLRGWSQAGAAASVGCGLLGPRAQELPYGRPALQLQPTLKTAE